MNFFLHHMESHVIGMFREVFREAYDGFSALLTMPLILTFFIKKCHYKKSFGSFCN